MDALANLRPQEQAAIEALLITPTTVEAAKVAGVARRTLARWLSEERFRAALAAARRESMRAALDKVRRVAGKAVDTLEAALSDEVAGIRIQAATVLLSSAMKAAEVADLAEQVATVVDRLDALERRATAVVSGQFQQ